MKYGRKYWQSRFYGNILYGLTESLFFTALFLVLINIIGPEIFQKSHLLYGLVFFSFSWMSYECSVPNFLYESEHELISKHFLLTRALRETVIFMLCLSAIQVFLSFEDNQFRRFEILIAGLTFFFVIAGLIFSGTFRLGSKAKSSERYDLSISYRSSSLRRAIFLGGPLLALIGFVTVTLLQRESALSLWMICILALVPRAYRLKSASILGVWKGIVNAAPMIIAGLLLLLSLMLIFG